MTRRSNSQLASVSVGRLYFPLLGSILGVCIFSGATWLLPLYFCLSYLVLPASSIRVTHFWRDPFNPLLLVLVIGFIRFSIPGLLSLNSEPDFLTFDIMRLERDAWIMGHALGLLGLLGLVLGWAVPADLGRQAVSEQSLFLSRLPGGVPYSAAIAMIIGLAALLVFVGSHASIITAAESGEMRSTEIRPGTGKYFYLGLMLISGSVVLSAHFIAKRFIWWVGYLPVVLAATCFWILGGRSRAFVPIACTTVLLWYARKQVSLPLKRILVVALLGLPVFSYVGELYRGGLGAEAFVHMFSPSALLGYVKYAVWLEWGQLHALAGAVSIGPGLLGGQTFTNLFWPLSQFLDLPAKSAGVFIAQNLMGEGENKWGFHATLVGDAYLNFGIIGVVIVTAILGILLKILYVSFRSGHLAPVYYALIVLYVLRIFFESVEKFGEALVVLTFAFAVIRVGGSILDLRHRAVRPTEVASDNIRTYRADDVATQFKG